MRREVWVTPLDVELLREIDRSQNLVHACSALGIGRDRGVYRLRRLRRAVGVPLVRTYKGGVVGGRTELSPLGHRLASGGPGPLPSDMAHPGRRSASSVVHLRGRWHARPYPNVEVPGGPRLWVSFLAQEGARVKLSLDPDSVILARKVLRTSARNVLAGSVVSIRRGPGPQAQVEAKVGPTRLRSWVTPQALAELDLRPGDRVYLYVKATALRPTT